MHIDLLSVVYSIEVTLGEFTMVVNKATLSQTRADKIAHHWTRKSVPCWSSG